MSNLPHDNNTLYRVAFSTKSHPGFLTATVVELRLDIVAMDESVRIDLVDNLYYGGLEEYVLNNAPIDRLKKALKDRS